MIKAEASIRAEYEHSKVAQVEVTVSTTKSLMYHEIVFLLAKCYETDPEITLHAIDGALDRMLEGDSND